MGYYCETLEEINESKVDEFLAMYEIDVTGKTLNQKKRLVNEMKLKESFNRDRYEESLDKKEIDNKEFIRLDTESRNRTYLAVANLYRIKDIKKLERKKNFGKIITNFKNKVKSIIKK